MLLSVLLPAPDVRPAPAARPLSRRPRRSLRWVEGVSVWLVMLLLLFVHPLYAEAADEPRPETGASFHFLSADGRWQAPAMVLTTDYRVTVTGLVAQTRLRQEFANTGREWREGVFVFPLPADASVHGLTMVAGERRIVGEIQSREMAQRAYEAARDHGQQAARVDQQRPNLFTTRLANIPPGESVTVELQYQQLVRYQSGEFELRLPTTLTPRYMPGRPASNPSRQWQEGWAVATTEVADAERISPFTVATADVADASHRARVEVTVNAGLPVARVTSPSHVLTTTWNGPAVTVTPTEELVTMDRDFVLRWQPVRSAEPAAAVFRETWQGEEYLLAMLVPGLDNGQWLARELVFVIDTSGSMAGESIRQARAALLEGLATLTPDDRFNVIRFDSETRSLFIDSVAASANNLARARRYVMALEADGGTEMAPALDAALGSEGTPGLVRQVVFITDGAVGNEAALFAAREMGWVTIHFTVIGGLLFAATAVMTLLWMQALGKSDRPSPASAALTDAAQLPAASPPVRRMAIGVLVHRRYRQCPHYALHARGGTLRSRHLHRDFRSGHPGGAIGRTVRQNESAGAD